MAAPTTVPDFFASSVISVISCATSARCYVSIDLSRTDVRTATSTTSQEFFAIPSHPYQLRHISTMPRQHRPIIVEEGAVVAGSKWIRCQNSHFHH